MAMYRLYFFPLKPSINQSINQSIQVLQLAFFGESDSNFSWERRDSHWENKVHTIQIQNNRLVNVHLALAMDRLYFFSK